MVLGHVKAGVTRHRPSPIWTPSARISRKTYPKDDAYMTFSLARPSLAGDMLGPGVKGFMTGMMLLAGLILLAACANLGSLFAARAPTAPAKLLCGLRSERAASAFCEEYSPRPCLISLVGGALGLLASVALLRELRAWQPIPEYPLYLPVTLECPCLLGRTVCWPWSADSSLAPSQ